MKIPSKLDLLLWGAVGLICVGGLALVNHWRLDSGRLKVERADRKAEQQLHAARVSQLEERAAIAIENARKANEVSDRYQKERARLEAERAAIPVRTVRLCHDRGAAVPAAAAGSASGTAGGHHAAGGEELPQAPGRDPRDRWSDDGPDVGPELYQLADEADQCAVQRDALQEWIRGRR